MNFKKIADTSFNKFHQRCFDINLHKIFRTNILENTINWPKFQMDGVD